MEQLYKIQSFGSLLQAMLNKQKNNRETKLLHSHIARANFYNHWFTEDAVLLRLRKISDYLVSKEFLSDYSAFLNSEFKRGHIIGVYSKEYIPLEEFPVLLSILLTGNSFLYKTSEKSDKLVPFLFELLGNSVPEFANCINSTDGNLKGANKLLFTQREEGNDVVKKYLEHKNALLEARHQSIAVINENENDETLTLLGNDIFSFFGMGCENVRKIYVPRGFDIHRIFRAFEPWYTLLNHNGYANSYQYYQSVYLLNQISFLDNDFLILKEDTSIHSPVGVLFYEFYDNMEALLNELHQSNNISYIYTSNPVRQREKAIGGSINQLLLPSVSLKQLLQ